MFPKQFQSILLPYDIVGSDYQNTSYIVIPQETLNYIALDENNCVCGLSSIQEVSIL